MKNPESVGKTIVDIHCHPLTRTNEESEIVTAATDEEIKKAGLAGFIKYDERKKGDMTISYYRTPKRFSAVSMINAKSP